MVNEGRRMVGTLVVDDDRIEEIIEGWMLNPLPPLMK